MHGATGGPSKGAADMRGWRSTRGSLGVIVGALAIGGCGSDRDQQPAPAGNPAVGARVSLPEAALARTKGSVLSPGARGFASRPTRATALTVEAPSRANDATVLSSRAARVELRAEGAAERQGELEDGKVVYHDAFPDTDVVVAAHGARYEELRILRSPSAPTTARYRLKVTGSVRPGPGGVEVLDLAGRLELRTLPASRPGRSGRSTSGSTRLAVSPSSSRSSTRPA